MPARRGPFYEILRRQSTIEKLATIFKTISLFMTIMYYYHTVFRTRCSNYYNENHML